MEAGWFSLVLGSLILTSILIRLDYKLNFTYFHYILYFFAIVSEILSKNKTIWIALLIILFFLMIIKTFIANYSNIRYSIYKLKQINSFNFVITFVLFVVFFFIINSILEQPIITIDMIEEKLKDERGKAFFAAIDLLKNSDWLGAYGFGFIQQYFSVYTDDIIGLDSDSSMLFNSYLDIWISVGILGLIYHLILLKISFSSTHLFTLVMPLYWFIFSNTNPTMGVEEYYLFLGISYGLILKNKQKKEFN
ncbi:MAG: O-antigen ligase family protein [Aliarcobacter sp.]|nr:O-antigen ligase family protein [Aliarcobacter sp.]